MQIEKLQDRPLGSELPCFRCHGIEATHRVTMTIGNHGGRLIVCLCESCSQLTETELYAHFVGNMYAKEPYKKKQTGNRSWLNVSIPADCILLLDEESKKEGRTRSEVASCLLQRAMKELVWRSKNGIK